MQKNAISPEELFRPRYKVIAPYLGMDCEVGDLLDTFLPNGELLAPMIMGGKQFKHPIRADKYPHLFKKLEWYEERSPEEMPEYVKHEHGWVDEHIGINHAGDSFVFIGRNDTVEWEFKYFTPATAAEYEQYINKKQNDE